MIKNKSSILITIQSPQKEVVEKVLDVLVKRDDFLGLFGYGSVFEDARTPSPTSDIDLIAVVDSSIWEFHLFQLDGIDVELFIIDVNTIVNNVMSRDNHFEIRNIGAGKIVYSNDSVIEEIKRMADERYYRLGSFPLNKTTIFFKRVNYYDLLEKVKRFQGDDTVDDLLLKLYLMDYLVERAIEDWFSLYKRYYEEPTYHIADMKRFGDEYMSDKCYQYYSLIGTQEGCKGDKGGKGYKGDKGDKGDKGVKGNIVEIQSKYDRNKTERLKQVRHYEVQGVYYHSEFGSPNWGRYIRPYILIPRNLDINL